MGIGEFVSIVLGSVRVSLQFSAWPAALGQIQTVSRFLPRIPLLVERECFPQFQLGAAQKSSTLLLLFRAQMPADPPVS